MATQGWSALGPCASLSVSSELYIQVDVNRARATDVNRKQWAKAVRLADAVVEGTEGQPIHPIAKKLRRTLTPPPTMTEVLGMVPGASLMEKARAIGISRQGFYALSKGTARRSDVLAKRLAELTGLDEQVIKDIW